MKPVRATRRELRLTTGESDNPTVDVFFDDHRVWSTKLPPAHARTGERRVPWPVAMAPYLRGASTLTIRNSATGADIASGEVDFGGPGRVAMIDAQGRWLAMNKWNRFGPSFEGDSSGVQGRLLASAALVAEQMQERNYPVYIVGGSLLGAMRTGALLPHDDDIDFAFWCDKTDPQDVTLVSFELQRQLESLGYTIVRHSHAHLEIVYFSDEGSTDYYIDVFIGYHSEDGLYNQPFAIRGELAEHDLVPTKMVAVSGINLPAPANPEAWLELAYGPDWLVPDPSFRWDTPRSTLRRFENSFGVFNRQRVFWEKTWQRVDKRGGAEPDEFVDAEQFLPLLPERAFVIDLGCGNGRQAEFIAAAGHEVLGVDYSFEALRVARQTQPAGVEYRFLNLNDRRTLIQFALELIDQGRAPYFYARNLLHEMRWLGRADLFVTLRGLLDAQTFMYATFDTTPVPRVVGNPETWMLDVKTLRREAARWQLATTMLTGRERRTPFGVRTSAAAVLWSGAPQGHPPAADVSRPQTFPAPPTTRTTP